MTNLENILQDIGLNEKESKIYLACLQLGSPTVAQISKRAKINRVTTYDILEKLLSKGMVSRSNINDTKIFEAIDPEVLVHEYQLKTTKLKEALPDLIRLKSDNPAPKIRYFEGLDGVKAIYEDTLGSSTEILNYANSVQVRNYWPEYDDEYVQRRVNKKIYLRGLTPDDDKGKSVVLNNPKYHREIRLINREKYNFPNEINIYDNKVAIISWELEMPIGLIIDDKYIAETQRAIFQMAWDFVDAKRRLSEWI